MKGISAMIATILLIAFTVAVGGILSLWFSSTASSTTGITGATAKNQTQCGGATIIIQSASSTLIRYYNPSVFNVSSINFIASDGTTWNASVGTGGFTVNGSMNIGSGSTSAVTWVKGTNTSVTATGLCQLSIPVSGRCDNTMTCWTLV